MEPSYLLKILDVEIPDSTQYYSPAINLTAHSIPNDPPSGQGRWVMLGRQFKGLYLDFQLFLGAGLGGNVEVYLMGGTAVGGLHINDKMTFSSGQELYGRLEVRSPIILFEVANWSGATITVQRGHAWVR